MFLKILGLIVGVGFLTVGILITLRARQVIQAIQKRKFQTTAEPRRPEIVMARVLGLLIALIGVYYSVIALLTLLV
jgi:hypothetical protein